MSQPTVVISPVESLADLLQTRNRIDSQIAQLIGRPALPGHIGEWVASQIFGVELHASATHKGSDGIFTEPPLRGRTVNIKFYGKREGILDLKTPDQTQPDFYLVLTGPKSPAVSSRGSSRPCLISEVFLFEAAPLLNRLHERHVKIGVATSVTAKEWDAARIYPDAGSSALYHLRPDQAAALMRLGGN